MTGWLRRIALVTSCIFAASICAARAATYSEADEHFARSEWSAARATYELIARDTPADPRAWLGVARSCARLGDWQVSVDAYAKLLALGPADANIRTEYGDALRQLGRLREAVEQYSVALDGAPEDKAALDAMSLADNWYTAGELEKARDAYVEIIAKYPNNLMAWLRLARIHAQMNEYAEAALAFEEIEERGGMNADIRLEYGDLLRKAGRLDEAIKQYEAALKSQGGLPQSKPQANPGGSPGIGPDCGIDETLAPPGTDRLGQGGREEELIPVQVVASKQPASAPAETTKQTEGAGVVLKKSSKRGTDADPSKQESKAFERQAAVGNVSPSFRPFVAGELPGDSSPAQAPDLWPETAPELAADDATGEMQSMSSRPPAPGTPASTARVAHAVTAGDGGFYVGREKDSAPTGLSSLFGTQGGRTGRQLNQEKQNGASEPVGDWLDQARKLIAEKRWAEAVYAFQQLMKERDLSTDELLMYGDALAENRDVQQAEGIFNTVLHSEPDNIDAKLGLAKVLAYSGKLDEAMYLLDQVQETADSARMARLARAKAYFANDYIQETWRDIGELLANEAGNQDIVDMINKGAPWPEIKALLEGRPGNEDVIELIERLNQAGLEQLGFMPADDAARAEQLFYQGDFEKALEEFERILRDDPQNLTALKRSGDIYRWDGRWRDALWAYEQYLELERDDAEAQLRHAEILLYGGDAEAALPEFWMIITNPAVEQEIYEQAVAGYAIGLGTLGRHDEALQWFVEALTLNPDNSEVRVAYADALAAMRRYKDAFEQYDLIIMSDPDFLGAVYGKARTYSWMGDQRTAQSLYDEIIDTERWYVPARVGKAYSLLWAGQRSQAMALAQEAAAVRPGDPEVIQLFERLGATPPPVLTAGYKQTHDSEDNDYSGQSAQLILPLNSRGATAIIDHEDFLLDNTHEAEESAGTHTRLTLSTPLGRDMTLTANAGKLEVDNGADPGINTWNWGMGLHTDPLRDWAGGAAYNEYTMYETTQIARSNVEVRETQAYSVWRLGQNTSLLASYAWADFSDGNNRANWLFKLNRQAVYAGRGTLDYGISHFRIGYDQPSTSGYWDPRRYQLTEVYLDWLDTSNRRWMFDGGAGLGYAQDAENGSDYTLRYKLGLRTRALHPNTVVRTGYEYNEAGTNATNAPNYHFGAWYLTAEYDF